MAKTVASKKKQHDIDTPLEEFTKKPSGTMRLQDVLNFAGNDIPEIFIAAKNDMTTKERYMFAVNKMKKMEGQLIGYLNSMKLPELLEKEVQTLEDLEKYEVVNMPEGFKAHLAEEIDGLEFEFHEKVWLYNDLLNQFGGWATQYVGSMFKKRAEQIMKGGRIIQPNKPGKIIMP